jgi:amino acid adenylation domain-containing protein
LTVAAASPDATAICSAGESLTFEQVRRRAAGIASSLHEAGVNEGDLVGLAIGRGVEPVVGALGILCAGAAYVPLEIAEPPDRLAHVVAEARLVRGLVDANTLAAVEPLLQTPIDIADCLHSDVDVPTNLDPDALACVIYTSGSSGSPKGVELQHRGVLALVDSLEFLLSEHDVRRVLLFSARGFDGSIQDVFPTLLTGRAVWALEDEPAEIHPEELLSDLVRADVDMITLPSSYLMVADPAEVDALPKVVAVAGERCPPILAQRWSSRTAFYNIYGPAEVTVVATLGRCTEQDVETVPIGRTLRDVNEAILRDANPVASGEIGELYLGGPMVARGYLGRPDLTAERFKTITLPDGTIERMYATGDLVRRGDGGNLIFIGRVDRQIKLRGHRIEPEDVEAALHASPGIDESVVMATGSDGLAERLMAFVKGPGATDVDALRAHLRACRPAFMIPSTFIPIEKWPTTPNGKIDHDALRGLAERSAL